MKKLSTLFVALAIWALGPQCFCQNATVLLDSTYVECSSVTSMSSKFYRKTIVHNRTGARYANFICTTGSGRTLKGFRCTVTGLGNSKRSYGKKDLVSTELSENLADDYTTHYLEISHPSYPYTVELEYQIDYNNGYIAMPVFSPAYYTDVAVEKAVYHLAVPATMTYSYKAVNTTITPQTPTMKGKSHAIWRMSDLQPYKTDAYMPHAETVLPHIYITPDKFSYYNVTGNSSSWEEYGKWQWGLMEGRDILPEKLKQTVHAITDTISNRREKIKALYAYLGRSTRYVSIQLGLGGLQPMSAEEVFKWGFGDCKALSNYLKAMLKECGIESCYVEINTDNPTIFRDHASVYQTNHAILKVPDPDGDLWLECTNTDIPFGYIHDNIAGHDAVVYANGHATIETLPDYPDSTNNISSCITVGISEDGSSKISVKEKYTNTCSENMSGITDLPHSKQAEIIKNEIAAPSCNIQEIKTSKTGDTNPVLQLEYHLSSNDFISRSGSRMFIPLSPFRVSTPKFNKERELEFDIRNGYSWIQHTRIELPQGYKIEGLPADLQKECCIGSILYKATPDEKGIDIIIERKLFSGKHHPSKIEEIREFFSIMGKIYSWKIVISKM